MEACNKGVKFASFVKASYASIEQSISICAIGNLKCLISSFKNMINRVSSILNNNNNRKWQFCLTFGTESKEKLALLVILIKSLF